MIVAIDGPAGAGKSTVARRLAERLGFRYLDTGAMYRAVTWLAIQRGLPLADGVQLGELAEDNPVEIDAQRRVRIAGTDVTASIRKSAIDRMVPVVARQEAVRRVMRARQRDLADDGDVVIEGRDIGTVVAPDADVKVYLTADSSARAQRRAAELSASDNRDHDAVRADIDRRDRADSSRAVSPLSVADDAVLMDTTDRTLEEVVAAIVELARDRVAVTHGG
jgi:cytidylate kinase